jgi:polysaccharide export outer membrane protein
MFRTSLTVLVLVLALATFAPSAAPPAYSDEAHVIGPEDVLQIEVWDALADKKEVEREVAVRLDGKISFPLAGEVQAAGLTAAQLTDALVKELSKSVKNPTVFVSVKEIRSFRVFLTGRVAKPGAYAFRPGIPVLQALTIAGGLAEGADLPAAYLVRKGQRIPIDLRRLYQDADLSQNIALQTDDVLVVPDIVAGANPQEVVERRIYILGRVQKPGVYTIRQEIPVLHAIFMAGGVVEPTANLAGAFVIRGKERISVDLRRLIQQGDLSQNVLIRPEDTIVVPEGGEVQNSVFIMGEINKPGAYTRAEALTLMKLLSLAGGFSKFAAPSRVTLLRENRADVSPDVKQHVRLRVDVNAIQRDPKGHPDIALEPGDVVIVPQTLF